MGFGDLGFKGSDMNKETEKKPRFLRLSQGSVSKAGKGGVSRPEMGKLFL